MLRYNYWAGGVHDRWISLKLFVRGEWWTTRFGQWLCERGGHTDVVWFNVGGLEPDMHCKRCGKDLG